MSDKELADRVLALGVIGMHDKYRRSFNDHEFARDWCVAGALMEKCIGHITYTTDPLLNGGWVVNRRRSGDTDIRVDGDSLPRAIITAAVRALEAK